MNLQCAENPFSGETRQRGLCVENPFGNERATACQQSPCRTGRDCVVSMEERDPFIHSAEMQGSPSDMLHRQEIALQDLSRGHADMMKLIQHQHLTVLARL